MSQSHETRIMVPIMAAPAEYGIMPNQVLFLLRSIQQGSIVLAGFIAIYFVYWHNILRDDIPVGLIAFIAVCSLNFLESYLFSAISLAQRDTSPRFQSLLQSSGPCSLIFAIGYIALRRVPFLKAWCEGDNWFKPIRESHGWQLSPAGVEEHHCALACTIIVAGAVALAFSLLISAYAAYGTWKELKPSNSKGYAIVGEMPDGFDEETLYEEDDLEK